MACELGQTIDFERFLEERGDTRFEAFRAHYPRCAECSREVAQWSRLQAALGNQVARPSNHPDEALLVSFASQPDSLEQAARWEISSHLYDCSACQSELRLLSGFDLAASVRAATATSETDPQALTRRLQEALETTTETIRGWLREPALAAVAAGLVVAAAGWLWLREPGQSTAPPAGLQHAQNAPEAPVEIAGEIAPPDTGPQAPAEPVAVPAPTPPVRHAEVDEQPGSTLADAREDSARERAVAPSPTDTTPRAIARTQPEPTPAEPLAEPIRIAALFPDAPIRYASPDSSLMGSASVRSFGVSRARGPSPSLELRVMAPEHVGWTAGATPTLYWQLSEAADLPLEITLLPDAQVEPLAEETRAGPHAAGLHSLSLADAGLRLEPGVVYRWQVALVVDPQRRSKDLRSAAAIVWKTPGGAPEAPATHARAHQLAASGYWYDAFAQLSTWLAAEPDARNLRAARDALLVQADLEPADDETGR